MAEATGPVVVVSTLPALLSTIASAAPGARIQIRGGTYGAGDTTSDTIVGHGSRQAPVQVEAYPGETVVLAKLLKVSGAIRWRGITIGRNSYPTDTRFGQGGSNPGGNVGLWINGADVELDRCTITGSTMSGLFGMGDRVQIWDTRITGNGTTHDDHGVYWGSGGAGGLVANCIIDHNACFGFQIQYSTGGVIVANCTIVYNGLNFAGSGTVQAASAHDVLYVNCISAFNGEVGFKSYTSGVNNRLRKCLAFGNPQGATYGTFDQTDVIAGDPKLDAQFRPQAGSAALGVGDPAYTPPLDFYGTVRTMADVGAVSR